MRHGKIDANQTQIVTAAGATVLSLADLGKGCPDLVCGYRGVNYLLEVKDGSKPPSKRKLTPDEAAWHAGWAGQVTVINSPDEALELLKIIAFV